MDTLSYEHSQNSGNIHIYLLNLSIYLLNFCDVEEALSKSVSSVLLNFSISIYYFCNYKQTNKTLLGNTSQPSCNMVCIEAVLTWL